MPPVVVFDTNILFSAIGWRGRPHECVELARSGRIGAVTCQELLDELAEKLQTKLGFTDEQITGVLADLLSFLAVVEISNILHIISADPDDDNVLECAVAGGAGYIISGDRRHILPLGSYQGITILNPADFLSKIKPSL